MDVNGCWLNLEFCCLISLCYVPPEQTNCGTTLCPLLWCQEHLTSYSRPITTEPYMVQTDVGRLINDFER